MKLIITVDTEADNQWKEGKAVSVKNTAFLPRFQLLCEKYNFPPTYLVTYEMANDPSTVSLLRKWQDAERAEVGAHLHPWTTPPFAQSYDSDHIYPTELSDEEFCSKLRELTQIIKEKFGRYPTSYRAGRWGFDLSHVKHLLSLGYKVDCSVTPKISWRETFGKRGGSGGPDFRTAPIKPYFICSSHSDKKSKNLLEIPMTVGFAGIIKNDNNYLSEKFIALNDSFLKKVLNKLFFRLRWLRVYSDSVAKDWRGLYKYALINNLPVIEFMIHSSELMPGGSPYSKTELAVEKIYRNLHEALSYFYDKKIEGCTLSAFANEFNKE